jgi:hypothetical protein
MKNVELSAILTATISREIFWYQKYLSVSFQHARKWETSLQCNITKYQANLIIHNV